MKVSILGEQACEAASLIPLSALHSQQPHRPRATCTEPTRARPAGTQPVPFPTWAPGPRRLGERPCSRTSSRGRAGLRPIRKPEAPPSAPPRRRELPAPVPGREQGPRPGHTGRLSSLLRSGPRRVPAPRWQLGLQVQSAGPRPEGQGCRGQGGRATAPAQPAAREQVTVPTTRPHSWRPTHHCSSSSVVLKPTLCTCTGCDLALGPSAEELPGPPSPSAS